MSRIWRRRTMIRSFGDFGRFVLCAAFLCGLVSAAGAQVLTQNRIIAPIRSDQMVALHGTVHPSVARAQDQGRLSGSTLISGMSLVFLRSPAQQADLKKLLAAQQTKGSPMYHRWLQPGQFAARYGVSQRDLAQVAAWLRLQGFQVSAIPPSADRIDFTGTVAQVEAAFQTKLHRYLLHGVQGWANATDISVPQAIAGMTLGVEHLNTFRPRPQIRKKAVRMSQNRLIAARSQYTVYTSGNVEQNFLAPSDIHTIYNVKGLYNANFTGTGQYLAIAGQTDITQYQSDIANFRSLSGLNAKNLPTQILVPNTGTNQVSAGDLEEADIDVEWSGAIAKDATILYVTVGNNQNYGVFDSLQYAVQTPLINNTQYVPVISISYGNCEQNFTTTDIQTEEQYLEQANAQGQTVVAAAGDSGSADCDTTGQNSSGQYVGATQGLAVNYPSSSQYATAAGGTSFNGDLNDQSKYWSTTNNSNNGSVLSYIPETTWNDTATLAQLSSPNGPQSLSAGGGGVSTLFSKPAWQVGYTPDDNHRDVPDVSLSGDANHDGYVLCTEETTGSGSNQTLSGTSSCAYPVGANEAPYFDANSQGYLYGGTSVVAPQLAAMITLWNQEQGNTKGVGNANPIFYLRAKNVPAAFHDVTTGSNAVVCQKGSPDCIADPNNSGNYIMSCCNAGTGYDLTTGLGSVDATALGAAWPAVTTIPAVSSNFSLASSGAVSVTPGSSTNTNIMLSPNTGFSGTVALACSNLPANVTCSFSPGSVNLAANTPQTVTLTIAATAAAQLRSPQPLRRSRGNWPMETAFAGILGTFLIGAGRKRRLFPNRWASRMVAVFVLSLGLIAAASMTACSSGTVASHGSGGGSGGSSGSGGGSTGGGSGSGSGSGGGSGSASSTTITVTGTSGSGATASTASTQIKLTIQ